MAAELAGALAAELAPLLAPKLVEGEIVKLDRANRQITLQRSAPGGTAGRGATPAEVFTLNHYPSFDTLKVGDQVTLRVEELNGVPQVTDFYK